MAFRGPHKNKRDGNESDIVDQLEARGIGVERIDVPVDLLCFYAGRTYLAEVKTPKGKLTRPQQVFFERWPNYVTVLRTTEDADRFAHEIRRSST